SYFVIDRDPDNRDIVDGYGFSGHGLKFAPLIGKLLAELALDREPSFDLSRFSIRRPKRKPRMAGGQPGKGEQPNQQQRSYAGFQTHQPTLTPCEPLQPPP